VSAYVASSSKYVGGGPQYAFVGQFERCPDTGRKHLQFAVNFGKKVRPLSVKDDESNVWLQGTHWEKSRGTWMQNLLYCTKESSREADTPRILINCCVPRKVNVLAEEQLRPWQRELLELFRTDPDDRTIHWWWEPCGNVGKTTFAKFICQTMNAIYITGSAADMKYGIASWLEDKGVAPDICICNIPRSAILNDGKIACSYSGFESIKDGLFYSTKYKSGMCIFPNPHFIVFSNVHPDVDSLSIDRWKIVDMREKI